MKNIIIAFLFCLPLLSQAQIFQDTGHKSKALWATSLMKPPADTLTHKQGIAIKNGILYYGNNINWVAASAGASGAYLFLSDSASMLLPYVRKGDSSFFKSVYAKRMQSGRFVFNKTALAWDSLQSFKITDSTRSSTGKLYGHETKFINGFEEAPYDSNYISRIKVNAATGVELSFSDQNNSDTNNIVKVDANGFTINIPSKGAGKVLQSDINGNATWVVPAGGGGAATDTTNKFINSIAVKNDSVITYNRGGNFTDIAVKGATDRLTNSLVNYVNLTTTQTIGGSKTFTSDLIVNGSIFGTRGVATNLWVGPGAGSGSTATSSVGIGNSALGSSSGSSQTAVGSGALFGGTGTSQTAVGESALSNSTGARSTAVGASAGSGNVGADLTSLGNSSAINNAAAQVTALGIATAIGNTFANQIHLGTGLIVTTANATNQVIFAPGSFQQRHSLGNYTANRDIAWKNASGTVAFTSDLNILTSYTVATLPVGTIGMIAYCTDLASPTYLGTLTGGGSVKAPVFFNGTIWVSF